MDLDTSHRSSRSHWPWLLAIPPAAAVIGGFITLYLAISRPDALVRDDCVRGGATMVCGSDVPHRK
jgi:hypothetical protein